MKGVFAVAWRHFHPWTVAVEPCLTGQGSCNENVIAHVDVGAQPVRRHVGPEIYACRLAAAREGSPKAYPADQVDLGRSPILMDFGPICLGNGHGAKVSPTCKTPYATCGLNFTNKAKASLTGAKVRD